MGECNGGKKGAESSSGAAGTNGAAQKSLEERIEDLKREIAKPFEPSGRRGWQQQLDAHTKRTAEAERQLRKLEEQQRKQQQAGQKKQEPAQTEKKASAPVWRRAAEGWYVGNDGHEIRQNYDTGGFDIVKIKNGKETFVKHFKKLSDAKKFNP